MLKTILISILLFTGLNAVAAEPDTFEGMGELYSASKNPSATFFDQGRVAGCTELYETGERKVSTYEFKKDGEKIAARENLIFGNNYLFSQNFWRTSLVAEGLRNSVKFKLHLRETLAGEIIIKMTGAWDHPIGYISCSVF